MPLSAECLKDITGLTNMRFQDMDAWSQGMIDGIANYAGNPDVEARCHAATAGIDAAIDDMLPVVRLHPGRDMLSLMLVAGTIWALLTYPEQRASDVSWLQVFEEFTRWISPIGMLPRRIAKPWTIGGVDLEPEDRVFFLIGSANRDETIFTDPDRFDTRCDTATSIAFGAGPHSCIGAWAFRGLLNLPVRW